MKTTKYHFYTEWVQDKGQFYADRHDFTDADDARNAHNSALKFFWATGKLEATVSDLFAITTVSDEKTGHARVHSRVSLQTGADMDSRAIKGESGKGYFFRKAKQHLGRNIAGGHDDDGAL